MTIVPNCDAMQRLMCLVPGFVWQSLIQGRIPNEEICLGSHLLNLRLPSQAETNRAKRFVDASPTGTPLHAQSHGDGKSKRHHCAWCALRPFNIHTPSPACGQTDPHMKLLQERNAVANRDWDVQFLQAFCPPLSSLLPLMLGPTTWPPDFGQEDLAFQI